MIKTPNPKAESDTKSTSDHGQSALADQPAINEIDSDDTNQTGLDASESRTIKQQRRLTSAKVLY
jgi:hypothetical protein